MSFDINWDRLNLDDSINNAIKEFLDHQFRSISLPSYISDLSVNNFSLGDISPEVNIRHIGDPFDEFYKDEEDEDEGTETDTNQDVKFNPNNHIYNNFEHSKPKYEDDGDYDDYDDDDDDDDDEEDDDYTNDHDDLSTFGSSNPPQPPPEPVLTPPPFLGRARETYLHNYNGIGLGTSTGGTETPTNILNQNVLKNNLRIQSLKKATMKNVDDIQLIVEFNYHGNAYLDLTANLLVNYPSPNFISLPVKLHITDLVIHALATIAYLKKSVYFSFLCDINDSVSDYFTSTNSSASTNTATTATTPADVVGTSTPHQTTPAVETPLSAHPTSGGNFVDYVSDQNMNERIDIIKKIKIESEIGQLEQNVLRNVGKVEKFLVEQIRRIIRDEIAWPSWVCIDLNDDDEEDDEDEKHDDHDEDHNNDGETNGEGDN
ncbi:mitochondrial distribution and morphology protein 12 [Scheffersomyces coipomensis]|uniref:mitochondrial distribution and morphology protein 12 n=1 Tax=Scheffersomyces coipomensis TaxID=1788519 RepID=UPI00315CD60C